MNHGMTYDEAIEAIVTKAQAMAEVRRHQCEWSDIVDELGDCDYYSGADILAILGY